MIHSVLTNNVYYKKKTGGCKKIGVHHGSGQMDHYQKMENDQTPASTRPTRCIGLNKTCIQSLAFY